jgi:predicted nucleic acid-binding Zn ribbon protein
MTTYVYETIPAEEGDSVQYFEIKQSMKDAPLTQHPETGQAIRRVILGGFGILKSENSSPASSGSCGCGPGGCCG